MFFRFFLTIREREGERERAGTESTFTHENGETAALISYLILMCQARRSQFNLVVGYPRDGVVGSVHRAFYGVESLSKQWLSTPSRGFQGHANRHRAGHTCAEQEHTAGTEGHRGVAKSRNDAFSCIGLK